MKAPKTKFDAIKLGMNDMPDSDVFVGNKKTGMFKAPVFEGFYAVDYNTCVMHPRDAMCYPIKLLEEKPLEDMIASKRSVALRTRIRFPYSCSTFAVSNAFSFYAKQVSPVHRHPEYESQSTGEVLWEAWSSMHARQYVNCESALYRRWLPSLKAGADPFRVVWVKKSLDHHVELGDYIVIENDLGARLKYSKFNNFIDPTYGITVGRNSPSIGVPVHVYLSLLKQQGAEFDYAYCYSQKEPGQPGYRIGLPVNERDSAPYPLP